MSYIKVFLYGIVCAGVVVGVVYLRYTLFISP